MDKNTGEVLLRLRETIDSWTAEVTRTRSALTKGLGSASDISAPAFRLIQSPGQAPPGEAKPASIAEKVQAEPSDDSAIELIEANRALMRRVEDLELKISAAERRAQETERERARLDAEIVFAREQLHLRNRSAQEAEDRRTEYEMQAGEATRALGGAELDIADLRQQLRSKDWRLLKTRNVLGVMREDHARRVVDVDALTLQVEALRAEVEERQASEREAISSLDATRGRNRELDASLEESKLKADKLGEEIQAIWEALNDSSEQLQKAREEIARLIAERDDRSAALSEMEEQMLAMKEREAAQDERVAEAGVRAEELEGTLAAQQRGSASLKEELAESRSALDAQLAELNEARDGFVRLQVDHDELMATHTVLRDDVKELQGRLAERDHALGETRKNLEDAMQDKQELVEKEAKSAGRIAELSEELNQKIAALAQGRQQLLEVETAVREQDHDLARALDEKSRALEASEKMVEDLCEEAAADDRRINELFEKLKTSEGMARDLHEEVEANDRSVLELRERVEANENTIGELREKVEADERLQQALRDELAASREQRESAGLDQASLIRALKEELEAMRQLAVERDFVIHHSEAESASMGRREAEVEDTLREALEASERMRLEAIEARETRKAIESELSDLLDTAREKDAGMRELSVELRALRARVQHIAESRASGERDAGAGEDDAPSAESQTPGTEGLGGMLRRVWKSTKRREE